MTLMIEPLAVWTSHSGIPERVVWKGVRYLVSDTPTPLDMNFDLVTHVEFAADGWRFQGTSGGGDSLIFDVVSVGKGQNWRVVKTYK